MAVLKIYQAGQVETASPTVPQVSGLSIPQGLVTQYGKAVGSLGEVIEKIALENKVEEDANEAANIIDGLQTKITDIYGKYNRSTKTSDVNNFAADIDALTFNSSNKKVDKEVQKYLRNIKRTNGLTLGKKILENSVTQSKSRKDDELFGFIMDITSQDESKQITGNRNYQTFFEKKENIDFYGEENLKKKKQEMDQLLAA